MQLKQANYQEIRDHMLPGDIIAFAGTAPISHLVQLATLTNISHVGIVCHATVSYHGELIIEIVESVKQGTHPETGQLITGVTRNRLSTKIRNYDGNAWWLPLSHATRAKLDYTAAIDFLLSVIGLPYDMPQALLSVFDLLDPIQRITYAAEDYSAFFCSELAAAALKAGKVLPDINASEMTPIDLLRQPIYHSEYYQIKGKPESIQF